MSRKTVSIEPQTSSNTKTFPALDAGPKLVCSSTDKFVQLKKVGWTAMQKLAKEFADQLDQNMLTLLLTPATQIRKGSGQKNAAIPLKKLNQASPEAFSIKGIYVRRKGPPTQVAGAHCSTPELDAAIKKAGVTIRVRKEGANITPAWRIIYEPYETQRRVAEVMLRNRIRSMEWTVPSSDLRMAASERVLELVAASTGTEDFLQRLCSPLLAWFREPIRKGANGANSVGVQRPLALAWFAIWLAERGVLLFPLKQTVGRGPDLLPIRYRHFLDQWIRPANLKIHVDAYYARIAPALNNSITLRDRAYLFLFTVNLGAPGIAFGRVHAACLGYVRDNITTHGDESVAITACWKVEHARLKAENMDPLRLQALNDLVIRSRATATVAGSKRFSFVDDPSFRPGYRARYHRPMPDVGPNLLAHLEEVRTIFPAVAGKCGTSLSTYIKIWLNFLTTLKDQDVPASLVDVEPSLLSATGKNEHKTLRAFMSIEKVPDESQRKVFSVLRKTWKALALGAGKGAQICPISDQLVSLPKRGQEKHPSSSTRRAIDMEILNLLIEENQAYDFRFSRERVNPHSGEKLDYRIVTDPDSGLGCKEWWPGIAVLMDLFLQIPIRHKQGRYLDSGEGDELELDIESLSFAPNEMKTATRGRNQCFIQRVSLSPLRDEPGLGMFINTNKTGRDYSFPWLLHEIAANVQRVIAWQRRFNPIFAPVSDRDDSHGDMAASVEKSWVYPIFRDPSRSTNEPVSSRIMLDYFRSLLRHVEAKYNLRNGTSISFFRPDGEPVYDIHSLRVTGVTRLLSMGVDPRIVRLLVGHASLTMTWYYEHVTNQRVSSTMRKAMEDLKPSREILLKMTHEEREAHLARLFNRSDQPLLSISLLRGLLDERSPQLSMMLDGFCPGMRCSEVGVWRDRACSLCKYFATGPAFLAGLELRLNDLMAEIIFRQQTIADLRGELFEKRRRGESICTLQGEIANSEQTVDNVISQWESQFQYVKKAEADLARWIDLRNGADEVASRNALTLLSPSSGAIQVALQETHHLSLLTSLVEGAKCVEGFRPTAGTREARDSMLLEIARRENKAELFIRLPLSTRKIALDHFALLILDQEPSSEQIQSLIDGQTSLSQISGAHEWLESMPVALSKGSLLIGADNNG